MCALETQSLIKILIHKHINVKKRRTFILFPTLILIAIATLAVVFYSGFKRETTRHPFSTTSAVSSLKNHYNLSKASNIYVLPDILNEVSGITDISSKEIGCIQDENGIIFIYDLQKKEITNQVNIVTEGDFEGITLVKDTMYMLRSDGKLLEVKNYQNKNNTVVSHHLALNSTNNEGLCYDEKRARLLIASKGKIGKGPEFKDIRVIYSFDLTTKTLVNEPAVEFSVNDIETFATKRNIRIPVKSRKKGEGVVSALRFMPSAIAVHPLTSNIYLLSAIDRMFLILDENGNIIHVECLSPELFNKPEGITFLENGDMLISNEGEGGKPTLLQFSFIKK